MNEERIYDIAFSFDESLTPIEKKTLIQNYGSSKKVLELNKSLLKNILGRKWTGNRYKPEEFIERAKNVSSFIDKAGIKILRFDETDYPEGLKEIPDIPFLIYYRGDISFNYKRSIAIVGTRKPNQDGIKRTANFTKTLVENNYTIISGLAEGIDTVSHSCCLNNKGKTIAVLGCGIDRVYPASNKQIGKAILDNGGGIMSEYPPGISPQKWYFPKRNRIIVGLSRGVLIVQSPERSGSLISAILSTDYNRELFIAKPDEHSPIDEGNRTLIRTGAKEISSPEEIIDEFGYY